MEEEANQLYQQPQMTGQARDAEEEDINIIIHHSTMNTNDSFNFKLPVHFHFFSDVVLNLFIPSHRLLTGLFFNLCELVHRHVTSGHLWIVYMRDFVFLFCLV